MHCQSQKSVKSHPEVVTEKLRRQAEEFDWTGCTFPMAVDKIKFFEKRNNVSVNVYYWDKAVYPLKITKEEKPFHVDLLLLKKDSQTHFALIKTFPDWLLPKLREEKQKDSSAKDASILSPELKVWRNTKRFAENSQRQRLNSQAANAFSKTGKE